jgi:hypothetical protein
MEESVMDRTTLLIVLSLVTLLLVLAFGVVMYVRARRERERGGESALARHGEHQPARPDRRRP